MIRILLRLSGGDGFRSLDRVVAGLGPTYRKGPARREEALLAAQSQTASTLSGLRGGLREGGRRGRAGLRVAALGCGPGGLRVSVGSEVLRFCISGGPSGSWGEAEAGEGGQGRLRPSHTGQLNPGGLREGDETQGQGTGQNQRYLLARPLAVEGPQVLEAFTLLPLGLPRALEGTRPCSP